MDFNNLKKLFLYLIFLQIIFLMFSCSLQSQESGIKEQKISVTFGTWNTQTFFDGINEGTEYDDFQNSKNWNQEKYKERLVRFCEITEALNPDIFVLQEIENEAVLQDIANLMSGNSWNKKKLWPYACFSKGKNEAIGCGIISKYPIVKIHTHNIQIKHDSKEQPPMRPIIQATISVHGKELNVLVNHWKSKSGGAEASEYWRKWQEGVLCRCIKNIADSGEKFCVAAGDFNKDIMEFNCNLDNRKNNIILNGNLVNCDNVPLYSPWFLENGNFSTKIGSYYFRGKWERIDNIFTFGEIEISDFSPRGEDPWADGEGIPNRYNFYTGQGYSDHLPLTCTLTF